ncbi:hypothetical protein UF75_3248 [Desulfosporosinus sp. I2]|nr:hypothetical protein [Desulfosporosinus sp. I2]KJR46381.1 hypothetical protein UF75_3248 [Desulfosporosinus sp. I2]
MCKHVAAVLHGVGAWLDETKQVTKREGKRGLMQKAGAKNMLPAF